MSTPRGSWRMHLYGATVDSGAGTPYDTVLLSTIAGYAGYATKSVYITQSGQMWDIESFPLAAVGGTVRATSKRRRKWSVVCYPFTFKQSTDQDLEDNDDLTSLIDSKPFLWVRFEAGERNQPSTTTAYPVYIESYSEDTRSGVHGVTLELRHRFRP